MNHHSRRSIGPRPSKLAEISDTGAAATASISRVISDLLHCIDDPGRAQKRGAAAPLLEFAAAKLAPGVG